MELSSRGALDDVQEEEEEEGEDLLGEYPFVCVTITVHAPKI